ncbi:class F sortase [Streptacidiphilus sp. PB12-B1b]|uniref:class F sortase n=1 Tax=Streptacidiphilus sp. PB12-B1b TaxID=2705012 RepID=UPI0015FB8EF0|nr:class F sortase [Streptacidiphilus sp. PB12-B1b]QMU75382.1 class F sortase [Streptacidiphilus sp. PB12-B1b]
MAELRLPGRSVRRTVGLATGTLSGCLCAVAFAGAALGLAHADRGLAAAGPQSAAASTASTSDDALHRTPGRAARTVHRPLDRSTPIQFSIPSVGLTAPLLGLGMDSKGSPELPPFSQPRTAGWLRDSVTPGEAGTAVLVGHVDTRTGPAVMWNLSAVRPGAQVEVVRLDGTTAVFTVDRLKTYAKTGFPAALVYGPSPDAELRIITCGGGYDRARQEYTGNVVLFAHLSGVR